MVIDTISAFLDDQLLTLIHPLEVLFPLLSEYCSFLIDLLVEVGSEVEKFLLKLLLKNI